MPHPLSHKYPIPISQLCLVNTNVPAGVGAPPLDTTLTTCNYFHFVETTFIRSPAHYSWLHVQYILVIRWENGLGLDDIIHCIMFLNPFNQEEKICEHIEVVHNCIDSVNISDALGDQSIQKQVYQKNPECQNDQNS